MINSPKRLVRKLINKTITSIRTQFLWENLYTFSLTQMNYGNGGDLTKSGELFVLNFLKNRFVNNSSIIIFDVGANIGDFTKAIVNVFQEKGIIYAFEPSKKTYNVFLENTRNIKGLIPNNFGFSDKQQQHLLFSNVDESALASLYQRKLDHIHIQMDKSEVIDLNTIDEYCSCNKIRRIHFLKLDIEGHELYALKGAKNMLEDGNIDIIQFEFGGCNIDSRTFFRDFYYLLKDKYDIYRILKDGIYKLKSYKETYEVFITINYLAIKK